jgi:SAM-dependent methyltransferase
MTVDTLAEHWNGRYSSIGSTGVSWYEPRPSMSLALFDRFGVSPAASVIDIGGGASRLIDSVLDRGHGDVSVLDVSSEALDEARDRLADRGRQVDWMVVDVREFLPERQWDVWHDRAVFHFLVDADDRRRYLDALSAGLAVGGLVIVAAFAADGPTECSGLPVERYGAERLFGELSAEVPLELLAAERKVHVTPSGSDQPFTWMVARRTEVS